MIPRSSRPETAASWSEENRLRRREAAASGQRSAMQVRAGEGDLRTLIEADPDVSSRLDSAALDEIFDEAASVRRRGVVFERVFGTPE